MSYDSLFAYTESIQGIQTAVWPPMHAYLFYVSRHLGAGVAGVFLTQAIMLFFSAALVFSMFIRRTWMILAAFLVFAALFIYFPTLWGTLAVLWKDVTTTSFAMLGVALWLVAIQKRSFGWLIGAMLALSMSLALRYNAFPLTFFVIVVMVMVPFGGQRRPGSRWITGGLALTGTALALLSMIYRLPDFQQLPSARGFAGVQEFDLIGISACANHDYLPLGMSAGQPITVEQIRRLYDPRHVQLAFRSIPGIPALIETDAGGDVERAWLVTVPKEFGCYLHHRMAVFEQQMGLAKGAVFYPTSGTIDKNPYGITLARPEAALALTGYIVRSANANWRRPYLLYVLAGVLVLAAVILGRRGRILLGALLLGAIAYPATLFFVGPAADARYIFPSNVICALLVTLSAFLLITRRDPT